METATAFNKSVKCRKKRKCVVCRRGGGGDDRSGLRDKCHQFLPQFVSRPHQPHQHQQQPCPGLGYFRTMLAVGPNVGAGPLSVSIVPSAESPLVAWTLASGPQFCSLMAAAHCHLVIIRIQGG